MTRKTKTIIIIIVIILAGLIGFSIWSLVSGQKVFWTTSTGEKRGVAIPKIPGMELISEEKGECSYQANYVYGLYSERDLSESIKGPLKDVILTKDWKIKDERIENGFHVVESYTEKAGALETITIKIGFEEGQGTLFSLEYKWPPCSESGI